MNSAEIRFPSLDIISFSRATERRRLMLLGLPYLHLNERNFTASSTAI